MARRSSFHSSGKIPEFQALLHSMRRTLSSVLRSALSRRFDVTLSDPGASLFLENVPLTSSLLENVPLLPFFFLSDG